MGQFERQVVSLKAQGDLLSKQPWAYQLAAATQAYLKEKGGFPRGAKHRQPFDRALDYRPDQRLSFFADYVPYLGEEYRDWRINETAGWDEGHNLVIAQRVVPHLVAVKQDRPVPPFVSYPGKDAPLANCSWVGVTGVGLDSAEYAANDAATAAKRGIFGYDRETKRDDVTDGLGNTIVLLMVPPTNPSPWLAGGGSTLRGVADADEDDKPIEPFVCMTFKGGERKTPFDGKKGTLAVMGDGKVRFIPADMSAATFRALCTIAGGEKIEKLDSIAPVVEDASQRELKGGLPKDREAEKPAPKKEEPKKEEPKEDAKKDEKSKDKEEKPKDKKASNNKGKIEGTKWTNEAGKVKILGKEAELPAGYITLEFKADGKFSQTMPVAKDKTVTIEGTYTLGEGDDVTMEADVPNLGKKKDTSQIVIKDDKMTISDKDGKLTFAKAKKK